jgi:hypothetical protein
MGRALSSLNVSSPMEAETARARKQLSRKSADSYLDRALSMAEKE